MSNHGNIDNRPVAVLGLGRFGLRIATQLSQGGEEVIACDRDRDVVDHIADRVAQAVAIDVTDESALRGRGIHRVKVAVIGIGEDFESSVLATVLLKEMNVPRIIARARSRTTAEVLRRVGAHEVVLAEDEAADRWANRIMGPRVLNQIEFHEGYSVVEILTPKPWIGKSLAEIGVRKQFGLHVVGVKREDVASAGGMRVMSMPPDQPLGAEDVLIIMGKDEAIRALREL
jgi:trk system potassium uptake protein TrkA